MIPNKNIFRVAVAALTITVGVTAAARGANANLISNGNFEACTGGLAGAGSTLNDCGWTFSNGAGGETGGNPGQAIRLESTGLATTDPTAQQTVAGLIIGNDYTLSWDRGVRYNFGTTGANGPSFGVFLDTQSFATALFLLPVSAISGLSSGPHAGGYVAESVSFTATATSHTFIFAGELDGRSNDAGRTDVSHRLDNVSLEGATSSISEPGLLAMFGGELFLIGAIRRRG